MKEQQKRIGAAEFRNTHFSYVLGDDGAEKFVATPELQSENSIGTDPLDPGKCGPSAGWSGRVPRPLPYRGQLRTWLWREDSQSPRSSGLAESVRCAEQNLYARSRELVGDRDPRSHEFTVQLRAFDAAKSGNQLGVGVAIALCSALVQKNTKGGLVVVGGIDLGGSIEPVHNAVSIAEHAVEKGATNLLIPISSRKQLNDLPDDMVTKIAIQYYSDLRDALDKALAD